MLVVVPEIFLVDIFPAIHSRYILGTCVWSIGKVCLEVVRKELAPGRLRSLEADGSDEREA